MMLEASLEDTINMTGLDTSEHHLTNEFINMLLGLSLAKGGRVQIKYETHYKVWIMIWCCFIDASQRASEREMEADMATSEVKS